MRMRSLGLGVIAIASLLLVPITARAQSSDAKAAAEVVFNEGKRLFEEKRYDEACPKFAESLRLDVGIGTMLYLGECYKQSGRIASAWAQFTEAAQVAHGKGDAREQVARDRAAELQPKLPRLRLEPPSGIAGLMIRRDGVEVGQTLWGTSMPVDPGVHLIELSAPKKKPQSVEVSVAIGEEKPVPLPNLEDAPADDVSGGSGETPPPDGRSQRIVAIAIGAVGLVGIGAGAYFGLSAKSRLDDSNADGHCVGNQCDAVGFDARNEARSSALASTICFIGGGLLVAGGAVLFFTAPRSSTTVTVTPSAAMSGGGAQVRFSF